MTKLSKKIVAIFLVMATLTLGAVPTMADTTPNFTLLGHVEKRGTEGLNSIDGEVTIGTVGKALRLEAIQIKLTGDLAENYDIYYRVHVQKIGWMDWAKNGETAGTVGQSLRVEALEIKLVEK